MSEPKKKQTLAMVGYGGQCLACGTRLRVYQCREPEGVIAQERCVGCGRPGRHVERMTHKFGLGLSRLPGYVAARRGVSFDFYPLGWLERQRWLAEHMP